MEISEFSLKLIIILIPGAVASIIFEKLTVHKKWAPFTFVAHSILFGGLCYLIPQWFFSTVLLDNRYYSFWENLPLKEIPYGIVVDATVISILVGFFGAWIDNKKVINRIGSCLGLSTKYGDESLFTYFLSTKEIREIYLRDLATNQTYHGMLVSYSEVGNIVELVIRDVKVYQYDNSQFLYEIKSLYLSRTKDLVTIEAF